MIKIIKQDDLIKIENIIITLYGQPGAGKTTLALSANKVILFDFDKGIQRAGLRGDSVQVSSWDDLANLTQDDLIDYDTIVIDTVGRMLEVLSLYLIKQNSKLGRATGELTLQGYGALGVAFKAWLNKIKSYGKDIVLIGHAKESTNNDQQIVRFDAVGSSKDEVLKCSDMLGFLEADNKNIKLNFNPTEKSLGKNCAGFDTLIIPSINDNNKFLAEIIQKTKDKINSLSEEQLAKQKELELFQENINSLIEADEFTEYTKLDFVINNPLFAAIVKRKANELGYIYNKELKAYEPKSETL